MIWKPNPKTSPTVNPLATQNGKNRGNFELRMGPIPLVVLLGVVGGCMVCSFYLGLISGQKAGFESAQLMNSDSVPKLPVNDDIQMAEIGEDEIASDVYAKLSNPTAMRETEDSKRELPILGSIKDIKAAPVLDSDLGAKVEEPSSASIERILGSVDSHAVDSLSKTGSTDLGKGSAATLGSLKMDESAGAQKEEGPGKDRVQVAQPKSNSQSNLVKDSLSANTILAKNNVTKSEPAAASKNLIGDDELKRESIALTEKKSEKAKDERSKGSSPKVLAMNVGNQEGSDAVPAARVADSNSLVRSVLPSGWFAQVAAPRSLKDAEGLAEKLKASGFPVVVEQASVRGQDYFRVIVGPEANRNQAQILVNQLKGESYLRGEPFLRLVR